MLNFDPFFLLTIFENKIMTACFNLEIRVNTIWQDTENERNNVKKHYEQAKIHSLEVYHWLQINIPPLTTKIWHILQHDIVKNFAFSVFCAAVGAFIFCICSPIIGGLYGALFYALTLSMVKVVSFLGIDKKIDARLCLVIILGVGFIITTAIMVHLLRLPLTYLLSIPLAALASIPYIMPIFLEE